MPLHFQRIPYPGACGKTRVVPHNRRPRENLENGGREVRVLFVSVGGQPGGDGRLVGLAARSQAALGRS
jgi:hypothetical protein